MVMGPTHAMSGAAASLGVLSVYTTTVGAVHPTVGIMCTVVAAGAALAPDIDSYRSTVVNSFGIFGRIGYSIANAISVAVYNTTKTRREETKTNGHRTFFHTSVMAIIAGLLVMFATLPTNVIEVFGREYTLGQFNAIIITSIFINLALGGLLESKAKKWRKQFGPYIMMLVSLIIAAIIAVFAPLPSDTSFGLGVAGGSYAYLGLAVAFGWFMHLLGDAITKMGVPMAWPFKIRGKRWYDVALPAFMRIRADGAFEKVFLLPALTIATVGLLIYNVILYV